MRFPRLIPSMASRSIQHLGCTAQQLFYPGHHRSQHGRQRHLQLAAGLCRAASPHGLTLLANYTWSKAIDDTPYNQSATAIASANSYVLPIYEPNFRRLDRGPSDFDHRNVISISYRLFDSEGAPRCPRSCPLRRQRLAAVGSPPDPQRRSSDCEFRLEQHSGSGQNRDRAVISGLTLTAVLPAHPPHTARIGSTPRASPTNAAAPANSYGTITKGSFIGPRYTDVDMALARNFSIKERADYAVPCRVLQHL